MGKMSWGKMCFTRTQPFGMKRFFCLQQNLTVFVWSDWQSVSFFFAKSFFLQIKQDFVAQNKEMMNVLSSFDDYYDDDMKNVITIEYIMKMRNDELFWSDESLFSVFRVVLISLSQKSH